MRYAPFKTGTHGDMYVLLYIYGNSSQETLPSGVQKQSVTPEGRAGFCHFHAVLACIGILYASLLGCPMGKEQCATLGKRDGPGTWHTG